MRSLINSLFSVTPSFPRFSSIISSTNFCISFILSLYSSYFGESASNLRAVFDYCKKEPVVLLLDECDFIAKSRVSTQDVGEVPRIVNMLLTLLDEYDAPGLTIATTNLKVTLDEALFRRFDDVIEIPIPGVRERERCGVVYVV